MRRVGLTGGIGSGKSAVSRLLARHGAVVVDADLIARDVVKPGTPGLAAVVAEFGEAVLLPDGTLDRPALGRRVFADPPALARLNAILHPLVAEEAARQFSAAERAGTPVAVHDVALLVENGLQDLYDDVVVVAASPETQLDRLVRLRGMDEADARARIAAQAPLADKVAVASYLIDNDGPLEDLASQVERVWLRLTADGPAASRPPLRRERNGPELSEPGRTVEG
jgi:dephospho-CoA kinase